MQLLNLFGNPNIGVYGYTNDLFCIVPPIITKSNTELISDVLNVPAYKLHISNSRIIGIFLSGNSKGLLVPRMITDREMTSIENIISELDLDFTIKILPSDLTAIGNNVLINDHAAIINPDYDPKIKELIRETCYVDEVIQRRIVNSKLVGSNALITNKGLLVNPNVRIEELDFLEDFFKVKADIGTVNRGVVYIGSSGIIANKYGAIIGRDTTGPELQRIGSVLEL
ncbi:MAG: translation initiation factor IF-6 [Candidatus Lokiarchaeota archaeon]|nr:translation initiation factor IF-6 [Candidatus Lokiarchaeota archaeon]